MDNAKYRVAFCNWKRTERNEKNNLAAFVELNIPTSYIKTLLEKSGKFHNCQDVLTKKFKENFCNLIEKFISGAWTKEYGSYIKVLLQKLEKLITVMSKVLSRFLLHILCICKITPDTRYLVLTMGIDYGMGIMDIVIAVIQISNHLATLCQTKISLHSLPFLISYRLKYDL